MMLSEALRFMRRRIDDLERKYQIAEGKLERTDLRRAMMFYYNQGIDIMKCARPDDMVDNKTRDYFLGKKDERWDREDTNDWLNKADQKEEDKRVLEEDDKSENSSVLHRFLTLCILWMKKKR